MFYFIGYAIGIVIAISLNTAVRREFAQFFNRSFPNELLGLSDMADAVVRGIVDESRYLQEARNAGINEERAITFLKLKRQLLPITELIDAYFKNLLGEEQLVLRASEIGLVEKDVLLLKELKKRRLPPEVVINAWFRNIDKAFWQGDIFQELRDEGWTDDRIKIIQEVSKYFPTPQDLVRFAVREAYTPEVVEKFRLDEDLPPKFIEEAKKLGMDEETAKLFWRAHWELPSATQGFEMFHRGIISYDELVLLLRTLDVMPFWRDRLIKLSYSPLTRIDVRRMHALGVLSYDEMVKAYQDLGYSPENAKRLADFTAKYNQLHPMVEDTEEDETRRRAKDLSGAQILKGYREKLITRDKAKEYLRSITYSEDEAEFLLALTDIEIDEEQDKTMMDIIETQYLEGIITFEEVQKLVQELNLPALKEEHFLTNLMKKKMKAQKRPSKDDLEKFLEKGVITEAEFTEEMSKLGYNDKYIKWYLQSLIKTRTK
jgi:hypothetical protein